MALVSIIYTYIARNLKSNLIKIALEFYTVVFCNMCVYSTIY